MKTGSPLRKTWGGKRAGSGRPANGNHRLQIQVNNETRKRLFTLANENGIYPQAGQESKWNAVFDIIFALLDAQKTP